MTKMHINQRPKRIRPTDLGPRKVDVTRVIGRLGNAVVIVDVARGPGYLRRMIEAKKVIHRRLGVSFRADAHEAWRAMILPPELGGFR